MKKVIVTFAMLAMMSIGAYAQEVVKLPVPDKSLNVTLMEALQNRHSEREFNPDKAISDMQLSQILWAACGVNRPEKGNLTVPSAMNVQDIVVYVCSADGVSLYNAKENTLTKVTDKDIRDIIADRQAGMKTAPIFLLLVSDQSKFRFKGEQWGAVDAGYVSQNICLMCAALGLKTVPRGSMNHEKIAEVLGLPETQILELNHPIGY